jgi:membrane-associated phospholipid phosphatase
MRGFSQIGSTSFLLPLILVSITYFVFRDRDWRAPAALAVAFVTDILVQDAVKTLVGRHRPPVSLMIGRYPPGSFPSGHTTQSMVVYGLIALLMIRIHPEWRRAPILLGAALIVVCVGVSRIYLGAHWLSDVAGGLVLGTFWIIVLHALFPFLLGRTPAPRRRSPSRSSTGHEVKSANHGR